jgi:hypothetical protein
MLRWLRLRQHDTEEATELQFHPAVRVQRHTQVIEDNDKGFRTSDVGLDEITSSSSSQSVLFLLFLWYASSIAAVPVNVIVHREIHSSFGLSLIQQGFTCCYAYILSRWKSGISEKALDSSIIRSTILPLGLINIYNYFN